ncbi:CDP-alcohol phosphatidyltransferase family protein [Bdellovibrionota bacterium]
MIPEPTFKEVIPLYIINGAVFFFYLLHITIYRGDHHRDEEARTGHRSPILTMRIREFWFWITSPVFNFFLKFKISPNQITTLGFLFSVAAGLFFAQGWIATAGWCVIAAGSMDFFDGRVARHLGLETKSGAFYDTILDRLGEGFVFLGLLLLYVNHWMFFVVFFAFLFSVLISYTKAKGETMGVEVKVGILQRPERIAYLGAPAIVWPMIFPFIHSSVPFLKYDLGIVFGLFVIMIFGCHTCWVRFNKVFQELKANEK